MTPLDLRPRAAALVLVASLGPALPGCGGGGTGDASTLAIGSAIGASGGASAPAPAASAAGSTPTAAPFTTMVSTCGLPDFVATALARINERRAAGATCGAQGTFPAVGAVAWEERLAVAADGHSRDMVGANFFSHTGTLGSTLTSRVNATSYAWGALGENLAAGTLGIPATIDGWMASPGHCANLMGAAFVDVGLACVPGNANTVYRTYWTMTLGRPR